MRTERGSSPRSRRKPARELGLAEGSAVIAIIKASDVIVATGDV
jgi:molybdopterin-binding protein